MKRRASLREVRVACPHCGEHQTIRLAPLVYIRLLKGLHERTVAWTRECGACGREMPVRVGDARRAA